MPVRWPFLFDAYSIIIYKAHILLRLGVSQCHTNTKPTHMITLNYAIFSNYYRWRRVRVVSGVGVSLCLIDYDSLCCA